MSEPAFRRCRRRASARPMSYHQDTDDDEPQVARAVAELPEADQESQHTVKLKSGADVYFWAYARPAKTRVETLRFRFPACDETNGREVFRLLSAKSTSIWTGSDKQKDWKQVSNCGWVPRPMGHNYTSLADADESRHSSRGHSEDEEDHSPDTAALQGPTLPAASRHLTKAAAPMPKRKGVDKPGRQVPRPQGLSSHVTSKEIQCTVKMKTGADVYFWAYLVSAARGKLRFKFPGCAETKKKVLYRTLSPQSGSIWHGSQEIDDWTQVSESGWVPNTLLDKYTSLEDVTDTTHSSLAHSEAEEDDDYTATPNALRAATRHLTTAICPTSAAVDPTAATPEPKRIKIKSIQDPEVSSPKIKAQGVQPNRKIRFKQNHSTPDALPGTMQETWPALKEGARSKAAYCHVPWGMRGGPTGVRPPVVWVNTKPEDIVRLSSTRAKALRDQAEDGQHGTDDDSTGQAGHGNRCADKDIVNLGAEKEVADQGKNTPEDLPDGLLGQRNSLLS